MATSHCALMRTVRSQARAPQPSLLRMTAKVSIRELCRTCSSPSLPLKVKKALDWVCGSPAKFFRNTAEPSRSAAAAAARCMAPASEFPSPSAYRSQVYLFALSLLAKISHAAEGISTPPRATSARVEGPRFALHKVCSFAVKEPVHRLHEHVRLIDKRHMS